MLVQDARYSVPLVQDARYLEARYLEGQELGYRHRGRGRGRSTISGTQTGNHGSTYTAGGGGNSHTTVAKFQYMPGGQGGGGGGWARPTAGEASSISGRNANTTADTALRCSQGFIGHLLSVAFCAEILRFVRCSGGLESAQTVATTVTTVCRTFTPDQDFTDLLPFAERAVTPGCHDSGTAGSAGPGGQTRIALGSTETEHDDADAVVVAALSANEWSDQHSRHSRFLRGDL